MLGEPEEHRWPKRHFWTLAVDSDDQWEEIRQWLDRGRMTDRVKALPRIVDGCRDGRILMIEDRGILTALILKFS